MFYKFPEITSFKEVEQAIRGRDEFVVADRDWGFAVDYVVSLEDTFKATGSTGLLRRECRGLKFDRGGNLIGRPYHKFFNLNEREETLSYNVDFSKSFVILDKLDGSMIHPIFIDNQVVYCTKLGPTEVAAPVQHFADTHTTIKYNPFCAALMNAGWTPIFEWCSPKQRIVVEYTDDNLILTGVRHMFSGIYMSNSEMRGWASMYNVPVVDLFNDSIDDINAFAERVASMTEGEGCIVRFFDGSMLKLKNLKYLRIHKVQELLKFEKSVWKVVVDKSLDDVVGFLPEEDQKWLLAFQDRFWKTVDTVANDLTWKVIEFNDNHNKGGSAKKFAVEFVNNPSNNFTGSEKSVMFAINNGYDAKEEILKFVGKNLGSATNLENAKSLLGISWKE